MFFRVRGIVGNCGGCRAINYTLPHTLDLRLRRPEADFHKSRRGTGLWIIEILAVLPTVLDYFPLVAAICIDFPRVALGRTKNGP